MKKLCLGFLAFVCVANSARALDPDQRDLNWAERKAGRVPERSAVGSPVSAQPVAQATASSPPRFRVDYNGNGTDEYLADIVRWTASLTELETALQNAERRGGELKIKISNKQYVTIAGTAAAVVAGAGALVPSRQRPKFAVAAVAAALTAIGARILGDGNVTELRMTEQDALLLKVKIIIAKKELGADVVMLRALHALEAELNGDEEPEEETPSHAPNSSVTWELERF